MDASQDPITLRAVDRALRPFLTALVDKASFDGETELWRVMRDHPQLIHIMNHGPMLGPWPAAAYLAKKAVDHGAGDRTPFGMFHRIFFQIPTLRRYIAQKFNSDRPFTFDEILEELQSGAYTDFMVLPEGDFCNFGDMRTLRPFRSHRYLELAIRLGAPVFITAHRGTETWALQTRLDNFGVKTLHALLPDNFRWIAENRVLNWQGLPARIPYFQVRTRLYFPKLRVEDLSPEPEVLAEQIRTESEEVRSILNQMLAELDAVAQQRNARLRQLSVRSRS